MGKYDNPEKTERFDGGLEVVLGQPAEEAEGTTGPEDMRPDTQRPTAQEDEDRQQSELQQQQDEHQERMGRPTSPGYTPASDTTPPSELVEPEAPKGKDTDPKE